MLESKHSMIRIPVLSAIIDNTNYYNINLKSDRVRARTLWAKRDEVTWISDTLTPAQPAGDEFAILAKREEIAC
jgi:hypothetical protein